VNPAQYDDAIVIIRLLHPLVIAFLLQAGNTRPLPAAVAGAVTDRLTGKPIAAATVDLVGIVQTKVQSYSIKTSSDGKFEFRNVLPSTGYWLGAAKEGEYVAALYRQSNPYDRGQQIPILAGQQIRDLQIELIPAGLITGRVFDGKGRPLAGVEVTARSPSYDGGPAARDSVELPLAAQIHMAGAKTNKQGEYRITGLKPGRYYVSVDGDVGRRQIVPLAGRSEDVEGHYQSIFFPGTTDAFAALPVDVHAGVTVGNIDIRRVPEVRLRHVRGMVIDDATGTPTRSAQVWLVPRDAPPDSLHTLSLLSKDGSFLFDIVAPGVYWAVALLGGPPGPAWGRTLVTVESANVDRVDIRVSTGVDISGRIRFNSGAAGSGPLAGIRIQLRPDPPSISGTLPRPRVVGTGGSLLASQNPNSEKQAPTSSAPLIVPRASGRVDGEGGFTIRNVAPWDYSIAISSLLDGYYVKSVRSGNDDVLNGGIHVAGHSAAPLDVVLANDGGRLDGRVSNGHGDPVTDVLAVLVGDGANPHRKDLYQTARTDPSGRFEFRSIAPGRYRVFAWQHVDEGAWQDPSFLKLYQDRQTRVEIEPGTVRTVELTVISPWL
jgi:hypothetical protein